QKCGFARGTARRPVRFAQGRLFAAALHATGLIRVLKGRSMEMPRRGSSSGHPVGWCVSAASLESNGRAVGLNLADFVDLDQAEAGGAGAAADLRGVDAGGQRDEERGVGGTDGELERADL